MNVTTITVVVIQGDGYTFDPHGEIFDEFETEAFDRATDPNAKVTVTCSDDIHV